MAAPPSPLNGQGNQIDLLTDASTSPGPSYYKHGINPQPIQGVSGAYMADHSVATHVSGEAITGTNHGVVAIAGENAGIILRALVDAVGNLRTAPVTSASGTTTGVTATGASTQLLAANANRRGFAIVNNATGANLYLLLAHTGAAGPTNLTVILGAGQYYEPPAGFVWVGQVLGAWSANTGVARITEFS